MRAGAAWIGVAAIGVIAACGAGQGSATAASPAASASASGAYEVCAEHASDQKVERWCRAVDASCGAVHEVVTVASAGGAKDTKERACGAPMSREECAEKRAAFRDARAAMEALPEADRGAATAMDAGQCKEGGLTGEAWSLGVEGRTTSACASKTKAAAVMEGLFLAVCGGE